MNTKQTATKANRYYQSHANGLLIENLQKVRKVAMKCDQLGLEILNIDSHQGKVAIEVANNDITRQMVRQQMAFAYKRARDEKGAYSEAKIVVDEVKVFWKDYEHPVITTRTH